jgi:uncharacterized membrane protein
MVPKLTHKMGAVMATLLLGLLVWSAVHLMPALAPDYRKQMQDRLGELPYKGLFALLVFAGLGLMVMGWRSVTPSLVYDLSAVRLLALLLVLLAFVIMAAAYVPSRLRLMIRHPQLTAVILWSCAHLLLNGDNRSILLFGGLLLWAIAEIFAINRRDGARETPRAPAWMMEIAVFAVGLAMYLLFAKAHPWLAGVAVL